jgi:hypothetical protein
MTLADMIELFEHGRVGARVGATAASEIVKALRIVEAERADMLQEIAIARTIEVKVGRKDR